MDTYVRNITRYRQYELYFSFQLATLLIAGKGIME